MGAGSRLCPRRARRCIATPTASTWTQSGPQRPSPRAADALRYSEMHDHCDGGTQRDTESASKAALVAATATSDEVSPPPLPRSHCCAGSCPSTARTSARASAARLCLAYAARRPRTDHVRDVCAAGRESPRGAAGQLGGRGARVGDRHRRALARRGCVCWWADARGGYGCAGGLCGCRGGEEAAAGAGERTCGGADLKSAAQATVLVRAIATGRATVEDIATADVLTPCPERGVYPLEAAACKRTDLLRALLERKADPNAISNAGTPHRASCALEVATRIRRACVTVPP
jgi:hypothetical protein